MTTMVDRVAAALCELARLPLGPSWEDLRDGERAYLRKRARAAIEAMREPTKEMIAAGTNAAEDALDSTTGSNNYGEMITSAELCSDAPHAIFQAMIDAALSEGKTP